MNDIVISVAYNNLHICLQLNEISLMYQYMCECVHDYTIIDVGASNVWMNASGQYAYYLG